MRGILYRIRRRDARRCPRGWFAILVLPGLICAGIVSPLSAVASPQLRVLVIGIDHYEELPDLAGAVNDARDIAGAFKRAGVRDLTVLENEAATRKGISSQWEALLARALPGDTVVLTYAGHGGQEPARVRGAERDGLDEVLLFGGFRSAGAGTQERLLDDELHRWFQAAGELGLKVIFVADSCHAGTLTRSIDARVPHVSVRMAHYTISEDLLDIGTLDESVSDDETLPHVNFLSAGQEYEQVPEVVLWGPTGDFEIRGALSFMFARALEGQADADGDGELRRSELWRFVRENVRMVSEARQTPNLQPSGNHDDPVLLTAFAPLPAQQGTVAQPLRLAILNGDPVSMAGILEQRLTEVQLVSIASRPHLLWDVAAGQVITVFGDIVARGVGVDGLPAVLDKWNAVERIKVLSAPTTLQLRVLPHDGLHLEGTEIEVEISGLQWHRLSLIGLSGNGTVHYLYPMSSDPARIETSHPFRVRLVVTPPFGADHIVAVSAATSLDSLNMALASLDGQAAALKIASLLEVAAQQVSGWQSGVQGLFTTPR